MTTRCALASPSSRFIYPHDIQTKSCRPVSRLHTNAISTTNRRMPVLYWRNATGLFWKEKVRRRTHKPALLIGQLSFKTQHHETNIQERSLHCSIFPFALCETYYFDVSIELSFRQSFRYTNCHFCILVDHATTTGISILYNNQSGSWRAMVIHCSDQTYFCIYMLPSTADMNAIRMVLVDFAKLKSSWIHSDAISRIQNHNVAYVAMPCSCNSTFAACNVVQLISEELDIHLWHLWSLLEERHTRIPVL